MKSIVCRGNQEQVWEGRNCMLKCLMVTKTKANSACLWKTLISTYASPQNVELVGKRFRGKFSESFE